MEQSVVLILESRRHSSETFHATMDALGNHQRLEERDTRDSI